MAGSKSKYPPAPPVAFVFNTLIICLSLLSAYLHPSFWTKAKATPTTWLAAHQNETYMTPTVQYQAQLLTTVTDKAGMQYFYELNEWKNTLLLPEAIRSKFSHEFNIWLRNYVAIHIVYFGLGALWAWWIYKVKIDTYFPKDKSGKRVMPSWEAIKAQMWVSEKAMPIYVMMPTMSEIFAERGWTHAAASIDSMGGWGAYFAWTFIYVTCVEWAIYWIHRWLHQSTWLYKNLHRDHHIYNNNGDLSPFAGLAFHPLDGCAQAAPYILFLFVMPCHYWTHEGLLFFTGVWTTNIHDTLVGNTEPVMGSKYHTYHHTHYVDNYGQFFVFWDWIHGTLTNPDMKSYGKADAAAVKDDESLDATETKKAK